MSALALLSQDTCAFPAFSQQLPWFTLFCASVFAAIHHFSSGEHGIIKPIASCFHDVKQGLQGFMSKHIQKWFICQLPILEQRQNSFLCVNCCYVHIAAMGVFCFFFSRWIHATGAQVQVNWILDVHVYSVCVLQHYMSIGYCFPETTIKTQSPPLPDSESPLRCFDPLISSKKKLFKLWCRNKGKQQPFIRLLFESAESTAEWEKSEVMLTGLYQSLKLEMQWNKCCTVALLTTAQLLRHMIQPLTLTSIDTIKASHIRRII